MRDSDGFVHHCSIEGMKIDPDEYWEAMNPPPKKKKRMVVQGASVKQLVRLKQNKQSVLK